MTADGQVHAFSVLNQSVVLYGVLTCFLTCTQASQKTGTMVWYSHLFKSFPHSVMIHTVIGFSGADERVVAKSGLTLCDLMDCSTPDFPVLHYFLEFVQIHVH